MAVIGVINQLNYRKRGPRGPHFAGPVSKDLAASLGAHFHVDAAWGFPLLLDKDHGRGLMKGAERADTVAVDGHKLCLDGWPWYPLVMSK